MTLLDDKPLSAMVEVYNELRARGLSPLVIGGCAVLLQGKLSNPADYGAPISSLLVATRVTVDVDLVLVTSRSDLAVAHQVFARLGYRLEGTGPARYVRGEGPNREEVDLLSAERPVGYKGDWIVPHLLPHLEALPTVEIEGINSMHPAGLIVLKSVAWTSKPTRKKDLVDIAQLALRDVNVGTAKQVLADLVPKLRRRAACRGAIRAMRKVKEQFRDQDANGAIEAARVLAAIDDISSREVLSAAVRQVLESLE